MRTAKYRFADSRIRRHKSTFSSYAGAWILRKYRNPDSYFIEPFIFPWLNRTFGGPAGGTVRHPDHPHTVAGMPVREVRHTLPIKGGCATAKLMMHLPYSRPGLHLISHRSGWATRASDTPARCTT